MVSTSEAKDHLHVTLDDDDTYIAGLVKAARKWCEHYTRRSFYTQTRKLYLERFPSLSDCSGPYYEGSILLPYGPRLTSVSVSIAYDDTNGDSQTLSTDNYRVTTADDPARIEPSYGNVWPSTRSQSEAVIVTYGTGYGVASACPEPIKQAILLLVGSMYENRESEVVNASSSKIEFAVEALLAPYVCGWDW